MPILIDLFLTFARVGVCTFGGGYAMLPILQRELVENKKWSTEEELADYYAVGQCTPGVIAVNTATFVGRSQAGVAGGIFATLQNFMHIQWVVHAFNGVRAGVVALILSSVIKLYKTSVLDWPTRVIYAVVLVLAALGAFAPLPGGTAGSVLSFMLSPVFLVIVAGAAGLCIRMKGGRGK